MCVNESVSFACGHSTPKIIRRCPLSTQWPETPQCTIPSDRPLHVSDMCPGCTRVAWVRDIVKKEAEHRALHEEGRCICKEVHTERERQQAREGAAERKIAKRKNDRITAGYSGNMLFGTAPQQSVDGAWSGAPYGLVPQQSASGRWNGASYGILPQQQVHQHGWKERAPEHYTQAIGKWNNATAEYYQQPNREWKNNNQQEVVTYKYHGNETLEPAVFVSNTQREYLSHLSATEKLATNLVSDRDIIMDTQINAGHSEQSTIIDVQADVSKTGQSTVVREQDEIEGEKERDVSPSPCVAIGSVASSHQPASVSRVVQEMNGVKATQPALQKLSVSNVIDNADNLFSAVTNTKPIHLQDPPLSKLKAFENTLKC